MKGSLISSKTHIAIFLLSFIFIRTSGAFAQQDSVSFDSLFPKTWYTKATESCMQVWGAFDDLASRQSMSQTEKSIIIDAAIGRLVFAQLCLELIVDSKEQTVSRDDILYLARVVTVVDERFVKITDSLDTDRAYCLRRVLDELQKKLQSFF